MTAKRWSSTGGIHTRRNRRNNSAKLDRDEVPASQSPETSQTGSLNLPNRRCPPRARRFFFTARVDNVLQLLVHLHLGNRRIGPGEKSSACRTIVTGTFLPMSKLRTYPRLIADPYALRAKFKLSQRDFWGTVGVSQSGGGLYERGRQMPRYLEVLMGIVYMGKEPPKPPKPIQEGKK